MTLGHDELLEAFQRATAELKFCPNRVWSIGGEKLPDLLPTSKSISSALSSRGGQGSYSEQNNHELCTFDFCEYSQRDFTAIQQRHECKDATSCIKLRGMFPRGILNEAASHEKSTVWKLTGNTMLEPPLPYMAVSHVWSDGTGAGAWRDGEVNECVYKFFRDIAEQFQCEGIWWDTICIPREKAARNKAIRRIQSNYQDARITLVHDCFLRNWLWDPETACFAILMSPWFSRGWTALELAKSSKVKVIFKGRYGPIIKDLDEEILAKENDPDSPRKEASRIIKNLRKEFTSINDLLTVLGPRYTSWSKDLATISALLVGVIPDEVQQNTYRRVLRKIGRLSPGHLFHNTATMSTGFSWCPASLFNIPLDMSSEESLVISDDGIRGKWRVKPVEVMLGNNCLWDFSHPLIRRLLQEALKQPENCWLLAKCGNRPVKEALLVRKLQNARCQYVGALYFRQELSVENIDDWIEKEVVISNDLDEKDMRSEYPRDRDSIDRIDRIDSDIPLIEEGENQKLSEVEALRRGVWRGDHMVVSKLGRKSQLHIADSLGRGPLHLAAERGDTRMIEVLLQKADLKAACNKGQTALHRACWGGSAAAVGLLLDHNSETDAEDTENNIPLHIAAQMGFEPIVKLLIEQNTPVNAEGCNKLTPLHYAAMNGHKEVAQLLLKTGAELSARDSKVGWTPLHCAAVIGDAELVELLITSGADVNQKDREVGWTPLHLAAMNGQNEVLQLLVKNGASYKAKDGYGWTPRQFAETNGPFEAVFPLPAKEDDTFTTKKLWTPLHCMAIEGQKHLIDFVVSSSAGFDLHCKDINWSPLLFAAKNGFDATIKWMLQEKASLETKDEFGDTPLSGAAAKGHEAVVDLLIRQGARIRARGAYGLTPISHAAKEGHAGIVEMLLENGAKSKGEKHDRLVPLSWAARMGHLPVVELLLDKGAKVDGNGEEENDNGWSEDEGSDNGIDEESDDEGSDDDDDDDDEIIEKSDMENASLGRLSGKVARFKVKSDYGMTPLSWAARMGHEAVAKLLLQKGAETKGNVDGSSPLSWAARKGHEGVVEILLEKGAEVNGEEHDHLTPLSWAAKMGHLPVVELLLEKGAKVDGFGEEEMLNKWNDESGQTPLLYAATEGYADIVALLLQKGANIEAKDKNDITPLVHAIGNDHQAVVELLLQEGANMELTEGAFSTPLQMAAATGNAAILTLLLQKGADMEVRDDVGRTLLFSVIEWGNEAITTLLIQGGANIEAVDYYGRTPLIYAAGKGNEAMVILLLQEGANIEARDKYGQTALLASTKNGFEAIVKVLLRKGANIDTRERHGRTPLIYATKKRHEAIATLLVQKGANIEAADENGWTPLILATENGWEAITALLLQEGAKNEADDKHNST